MTYRVPQSASILCNARVAIPVTNSVLSNVTFNNVDIGASHFQGSVPYTGVILPAAGAYEFRLSGWRCGGGDGTMRVTSTRGVTVVYDQSWQASYIDCSVFHDHFLIPNCQAGDVVTFQLNENNTATQVTSITNSTSQPQGNLIVIYWPVYGL